MIDVTILKPADQREYQGFLSENSRHLIYISLEFRDFLSSAIQGIPFYLIARKNNKIAGVLPYFKIDHQEFGTVINSLPWYGSHGGCYLKDDSDSAVRKALLNEFKSIVNRSEVLTSTIIVTPTENRYIQQYIDILKIGIFDQRIGQINSLPAPGLDIENRLMMSFKQKTRNLVRKSLKQSFTIEVSDADWAWQFLQTVHAENMSAIGAEPKPRSHYDAIRTKIPINQKKLFVAKLNDKAVAALLLLYFNNTVEYLIPVIKRDYRPIQPLSFLIYYAMLDAVEIGFRWWNWGGTWISQKSLNHFKKGWGAADAPYTYLVKAQPDAVDTIKQHIKKIAQSYPFYYIFPFNLV